MDSFAGHEYAEKIHLRGRGWDTEGSDFEELMGTGIFSRASRAVATVFVCHLSHCNIALARRLCRRSKWLALFATVLLSQNAVSSQFVQLDYNLTMASRSRNTAFLELFDDKPLTTANFLQYVNNVGVTHGNYSGSFMHRLSRNFVIQGGGFWPNFVQEPAPLNVSLDPTAVIDLDGNPATSNPNVPGEYGLSPVRSNLVGTISMALSAGPNTGTSQWFVNLANNSFLDSATSGGPFTVFGRVAGDGMALFNAFNTLSIANLNPDVNDDGVRDGGPFYVSSDTSGNVIDGVPYLHGNSDLLVIINQAKQVDYLGANITTNVPDGGLTFSARDAFIDTGTAFTGSGGITIGPGRTLGIREGISLGRDLTVHGTLAPGSQLGQITVQNYLQYTDGKLSIQLAGKTADTLYDRIVATNTALLSGKLSVSLINSFVPSANDSFSVVSANSIVGVFSQFELPQLAAGLVWNISRSSTNYLLTVVSADFNRNGVVDAADYIVWRNTRDQTVTPYSGADADGNGLVNDADLAIWRANFGNVRGTAGAGAGAGLAASNVPEPASVAMLFSGVIWFAASRRRR